MFMEEEYGVEPEYGELNVVFEDDHVLIVNKQGQMDTHPSEKMGREHLPILLLFIFKCKV